MLEDSSFNRFIKWTIAAVVAGVLLVVLCVLVVDPYRLHRIVEVAGFNMIKPGLERYQAEIKVAGAKSAGADVFLMGNSRVEVGLDPDSGAFDHSRHSVYNLAVAGSGVSVAQREFEDLRAAGRNPSIVVLGVEFIDFLMDSRAAAPPTQARNGVLAANKWRFDTLFSLSSFIDAGKTLRIQRNGEATIMTARGFNPLREYEHHARVEGYDAIFRQAAIEGAKRLARKPHGLVAAHSGTSSDWEGVRALMAGAAGDGAQIHLVIYPYHAQILAMFEQTGLWPVFEEWKAMLAGEVERARTLHPGATITLWDFSGFGPIQCERIPAKGDLATATRWYWEAGHFKSALGDVVLGDVLGARAVPQLGVRLGVDNLDENRRRIARERSQCAAAYPALFADVARLVASATAAP